MTVSEKIAVLSGRLTRARFARLSRALDFRTRKIILVLEDVFQPHNAAAVLRNCDAFGLQEVHIIENRYRAKISSNVDTGVSKWMDIIRHTSSLARPSKVGMGREKLLAEHLENLCFQCLCWGLPRALICLYFQRFASQTYRAG